MERISGGKEYFSLRHDAIGSERREHMSEKRAWVITALWFGTIALVGLLKRTLERQRPG
jgi:hypothetical protein